MSLCAALHPLAYEWEEPYHREHKSKAEYADGGEVDSLSFGVMFFNFWVMVTVLSESAERYFSV